MIEQHFCKCLFTQCLCVQQHFRYFTDILNMLQGFYVFLIFVCKRNVYQEILKKTGRYDFQSSKGQALKRMNRESSTVSGTSTTQVTRVQSQPLA